MFTVSVSAVDPGMAQPQILGEEDTCMLFSRHYDLVDCSNTVELLNFFIQPGGFQSISRPVHNLIGT